MRRIVEDINSKLQTIIRTYNRPPPNPLTLIELKAIEEKVDIELQKVIQTSSVGKIFLDLNNMEEVLEKSGLDTLAVRPVAIVNGDASGGARIVDRFEKTSKIFTGDIARWMLDAVERPAPFAERAEMIGSSFQPAKT